MWKWLEKLLVYEYKENKEHKPKRARTKRGRYKGDDKSTDTYNEAWVSGKAPKRKRKRKK